MMCIFTRSYALYGFNRELSDMVWGIGMNSNMNRQNWLTKATESPDVCVC